MRNYASLCIACYVLGIGDRHLENFLIDVNTSEITAIDFGVAFGQGLVQLIPELIPFRLTSQIRNIIYPFGKRGALRQSMIDTLGALKGDSEYILDYCEVFVKEPLLDWIKVSKSKTANQSASGSNNCNNNEEDIDQLWLPAKKLKIIELKLQGTNPLNVILEEIKDTRHNGEVNI